VNAKTGDTFILPLFKAKNSDPANYLAGVGQGSNYYYNITRFVAVRITSPKNENRYIQVQPVAVIDPDAIFMAGGVAPAGTQTRPISFFAVPKLTR
jgi:hypothetical protein